MGDWHSVPASVNPVDPNAQFEYEHNPHFHRVNILTFTGLTSSQKVAAITARQFLFNFQFTPS
jgi:hypothetical protein